MKEGFKGALIGGIIGAIATTLVGGAVAVLTNVRYAITDWTIFQATDSILNHMRVRLREGTTENNSDFRATCEGDEIVVGGRCIITDGNGALQNLGTSDDGKYFTCTYSRRADATVKGRIFAACLGLR
jgi:hypothetical protein